jgi:hypothetical protein
LPAGWSLWRVPYNPEVGSPEWLRFADPAFDFEFSYPPTGTAARVVTVREQERTDRRRVHISTDDARDVYFELERVDRRTVAQGVAELSSDLSARYSDVTVAHLEPVMLAGLPASLLRFTFADRVRAAYFTEQASPAHRVILDPRSPTNLEILATLVARG